MNLISLVAFTRRVAPAPPFCRVPPAWRSRFWIVLCVSMLSAPSILLRAGSGDFFAIQVIDESTGRGVPLVELRTVHNVSFRTDSAGFVALNEPELMGQETYFFVESPG